MFKGWVSESWAKRHAGGWFEELGEDHDAPSAAPASRH
jgi:cytochrome b subunit of formate dehydrogenase